MADCPCWGPLSLYPLAVSALSYVPFVSVPRRAPLSSHPFQVFRLSHVPSGPRRGTSLRNLHFLKEIAPWRLPDVVLPRKSNFLRPRTPKTIISLRKWALEAPGFLFKRLPFKFHPRPKTMILLRNSSLEPRSLQAVLFWEIKVSAPRSRFPSALPAAPLSSHPFPISKLTSVAFWPSQTDSGFTTWMHHSDVSVRALISLPWAPWGYPGHQNITVSRRPRDFDVMDNRHCS